MRTRRILNWPKVKSHVETGKVVAMGAFSGQIESHWRKQLVQTLATQAVDLARQRDLEALVRCLSGIPLGTFLHIRALLIERDDYAPVVDALIEGLTHPSPRVRYECAGAMDHLADDRCVEPLRRLLDDPVPRVRRMALHALSCDACKLTPLRTDLDFVALAIERATTDPSINVRRHAVAGLAVRCFDARARQTLSALLAKETDPAILRYARQALRGPAQPIQLKR